MKKTNLMELCLSPDLGGLELYVARCAKALSEDFNVISVIHANGKLLPYYQETPHRYIAIEKKSNLFMFRAARKLSKIIDENAIDILHIHWTKDIPIAVLAKKLSKQNPKIVQTRHMTMTRFKNDFYHRFLYQNIDMILAVTRQVADQIHKFIPEDIRPKVKVAYIGSDETQLLTDTEVQSLRHNLGMGDSFAIGMVGRIEETKGQYLLIDAIGQLRQQGINVKGYFVGHPMNEHYLDNLKQKVKDLHLEDAVFFLGFMKNPRHFMQACDTVVLATEHETFGLVLIEAMHVGTAVIGSNRGGVLEIIDDHETGLLFESMHSESLAQQIQTLYENPDLLQTYAANGKMKAQEKFSDKKQFHELSTILQEL